MVSQVVVFCAILFIKSINCYSSCTTYLDINECDYCLSQIDFKFGTYRIRNPGTYCLAEDIIFNPLPPSEPTFTPNTEDPLSWFPSDNSTYPGCSTMEDGPFALGFFSVISIETSNVIIDLSGHKISYHFQFYLEQRFGSIIEISNQPFLPSTNLYTDFGDNFIQVSNIIIRNGELGLTAHHGIHSNNATNITITNMKIYDFEVAGIQLNGFYHAIIENVDIGPSLKNVPLTAFYSNARYLLLAMTQLLNGIDEYDLPMPNIPFSYLSAGEIFDEDNVLTLKQIKDNLVEAMDIIFKYYTSNYDDTNTKDEAYKNAMRLFNNDGNIPDGSAMYGIILNSYDIAINDFGDSINNGIRQGTDIKMNNITMHDLSLKTREVIGVNFAECHHIKYETKPKVTLAPDGPPIATPSPEYVYWHNWYYDNYDYFYDGPDDDDTVQRRRRRLTVQYDNEYEIVSSGPFGDVMDITQMIPSKQVELITNYDGTQDLTVLDYIGNPLSDAQIALYLFGNYLNDGRDYSYSSFISHYLLKWAVEGMKFPPNICVRFIRNRDNMYQTNKGIVGVRMDGIEDAEINNITIVNLFNKASMIPDDDINVRGISIIDGDLHLKGNNIISNLESWYGISKGLDIMDDISYIDYDQGSTLNIYNLISRSRVASNNHDSGSLSLLIIASIGCIILICIICICTYFIKSDNNQSKNNGSNTKKKQHHSVEIARIDSVDGFDGRAVVTPYGDNDNNWKYN